MWAGLWLFGLETEQIATSDTVGNGCECGIKCSFILEFSIFTTHHRRDALRDVPVKGPYRGANPLLQRKGVQTIRAA
jgi:hypothetical protein